MPARRADDPELQPPVGDELDHRLRVGDRQLDAQLGIGALEFAEQERQDDRRRPGGGADLERAAQRRVRLGDLVEQLLLEREHPLCAPVEAEPGLGRLDPPTGAVEQLRPEPLLERAHLLGDGRLRHAEPGSRLGEAPPLDHLAERSKLARVHKRILSSRAVRVGFRCASGST